MPRIKMSEKLNNSSKLMNINTEEYVEMFLDAAGISPSKKNNYPVENIEELADNMLLVGHLEPLLIGRVEGKDNIISGHRRFSAIQYNINRGYGKFKKVRCLVKEMSEPMFMLTLISGNAFNRILDDVTLVQQAKDYKEWLARAVKNGDVTIEGTLRDYVAKALGVSSTKMAQVDKINSSLCKEGMQAFNNGEVNFSKSYETSRLPEDEQKEVIQSSRLLSKDVKELAQAYKTQKEKQVNGDKDKMLQAMDEELARVILEELAYGNWLNENYDITETKDKTEKLIGLLKDKGKIKLPTDDNIHFIFFTNHYDAVNKTNSFMSRQSYDNLLNIVITSWQSKEQEGHIAKNVNVTFLEDTEDIDAPPIPHVTFNKMETEKEDDEVAISQPEMIPGPEKREEQETEPVYRFPILKNNDERKEWIKNYEKWGVWHKNPTLGITYYRFIFPDGIQLIVEEMPAYKQYWSEHLYTQVIYHILGKKPERTETKFDIHEEFRHSGSSETEVIELLKYEKKQQ